MRLLSTKLVGAWRNGGARALGARGCGFESHRPDQDPEPDGEGVSPAAARTILHCSFVSSDPLEPLRRLPVRGVLVRDPWRLRLGQRGYWSTTAAGIRQRSPMIPTISPVGPRLTITCSG